MITYNARGYPPSDVPETVDAYSQEQATDDIVGLMRHLGIAQAHLVGLSMGAMPSCTLGCATPPWRASRGGWLWLRLGGERTQRFQQDSAQVAQRFERDGMRAVATVYSQGPHARTVRRQRS